MTYYVLVFVAFNFIGEPIDGNIAIKKTSHLPYSFANERECEEAFDKLKGRDLTARYIHTCAPISR